MSAPDREKIRGVLERILFLNEENHYCVAELRPDDGSRAITIAGALPHVQCGESLALEGEWSHHPRFGDQFKIHSFRSELPATIHGIRKYLGSGMVPGIGPGLAEKIVDFFGEKTLTILSEESASLQKIPGIGHQRAKAIKAAWDQQCLEREIMIFLQTYGVTPGQCLRLIRQYGDQTQQILRENPFRMAREVRGIGFKTADRIARNLGLPNDHPSRLEAGLIHLLQAAEDEGHTMVMDDRLIQQTGELLEVDPGPIEAALTRLEKSRDLVFRATDEGRFIQLPNHYRAEKSIAGQLRISLREPSGLPPIQVEKAILWAQEKASFRFAPEQADGLRNALQSKVSLLTGGPGTGKTTILRALVAILKAKKVKILLGAPTGRAARRLEESARHSAQTLHRLLRYDATQNMFGANQEHPLSASFVIVDEASMLDTSLASALISALRPSAHLLLVGDIDQLPSVGAGQVLADLMTHPGISVTRLQAVFRQARGNSIIEIAHDINRGAVRPPPRFPSPGTIDWSCDTLFLECPRPDLAAEWLVELVSSALPRQTGFDPRRQVQVLAPMHRGEVGVENLNLALQKALNPTGPALTIGKNTFRPGDRLIQMKNNYDKFIFNGDMGEVIAVDANDRTLTASFEGKVHEFTREECSDLALAYAISIHKSQGSEYPIVIIPLFKQHFLMLRRNLVYTALTRARKKAIFIGDLTAYAMAVRQPNTEARQTGLTHLFAPK